MPVGRLSRIIATFPQRFRSDGSARVLPSSSAMQAERGAITIHVAIAMIALLAFCGMVVDQGIMYVARRQAQNAADAGALAGVGSLLNTPGNTAIATLTAQQFATVNAVWGENTSSNDIRVWPIPLNCPDDGKPACVRVDLFRGVGDPNAGGSAHRNVIPTLMMRMFAIPSQGVRATATAQIGAGNAVSCIKPWVVADKWNDVSTGASGGLVPSAWDQMDTFDEAAGDTFSPTSGFKASGANNDYGTELVLKSGQMNNWTAGWSEEIDLGQGNATSAYEDEITSCPTWVPTVGLYNPSHQCLTRSDTDTVQGCINVKPGMSAQPTQRSVDTLRSLDSGATWNTSTNQLDGSCMATGSCRDAAGAPAQTSARIVPLALFNLQALIDSGCTGNNCVARVTNLLGFFVEGMCDEVYPNQATRPPYCGTNSQARNMIVGRLMAYPGQTRSSSGSASDYTFIKVLRLIR